MSKSRGFTLIELLVTITIIAILAAIGLVTYSLALKQGRDSKRQSDLRAIQSALEQYNSDQFFYPSNPRMELLLINGGSLTSSIGNPSPPSPAKIYLNSIPFDPTRTTTIRYIYKTIPDNCNNTTTARCTNYCLYAYLENRPSPVPPVPAGCPQYPPGFTFAISSP